MTQSNTILIGDAISFANEMKKLINQKESSDVRFVIGPTRKTVYAHRYILAARCDVFRVMFADQSSKHKDGDVPLVLSDITQDVFYPLLEYIYTNTVTLSSKVAVDVLGSAIEYGLEGLQKLCVTHLTDKLDVETACEVMQAGVTYSQPELQQEAMKFIESHTKGVFKTKGFQEMSDTALAKVLQSDYLTIDEPDVLTAVKDWAAVNSVVFGKSIQVVAKKVIIHVRLPLFSPQQLKEVEKENKKDKLIPTEHIAYAWRYHALKEDDPKNPLTRRRRGTSSHDKEHSSK